jgi:hypothetical protein
MGSDGADESRARRPATVERDRAAGAGDRGARNQGVGGAAVNRAPGPASPAPEARTATGDLRDCVEAAVTVAPDAHVGPAAVSASDPTRGVLLPPFRRASRPDARRRWRPAIPMATAT